MHHSSKLSPRQSETVFDEEMPVSSRATSRASSREDADILKLRTRRKKTRRRRWSVWLLTGACALFAALLLVTIVSVQREHSRWQTRVAQREAELQSLEAQLENGQTRLAALKSPQGRQQLLINNGYLKPGDRYLEFPHDAAETRLAQVSPNELSPQVRATREWSGSPVEGGSMWRGAWKTLAEKWQQLRP